MCLETKLSVITQWVDVDFRLYLFNPYEDELLINWCYPTHLLLDTINPLKPFPLLLDGRPS